MIRNLLSQLYQVVGLAYYHVFLGPRGQGRPTSVSTWNAQYRTGHWDNFETMDEMPRYAVIASYIRNYSAAPTVLDVGCGYGRLIAELHTSGVDHYFGIDVSAEAIARAHSRPLPNVSFGVGDFSRWQTDAKFHVIVFNDTLYYAKHPIAVLERYVNMLEDGGVIIVGMYRHRNTMVIWRDIAKRFTSIDRIEVRNAKGELTDIRVLMPPKRSRPRTDAGTPAAPPRAPVQLACTSPTVARRS